MKIFATIILFASIASFITYAYLYAGCDVPLEYQKERLVTHLDSKALPTQYLSYDEAGSTECRHSFHYKSETENIHFVIIDGGKITYWDYNAR